MRQKIRELLGSQEAIDNLATLASMNLDAPPLLGIVDDRRFVTDPQEFGDPSTIRWLSGEGDEGILALLDWTYASLHHYLQGLYANSEMDWESQESKEGLASLMVLVGESAEKMTRYLNYRLDSTKEDIRNLPGFQALQAFYSKWFAKRLGEEAREQAVQNTSEPIDFEAMKSDRDYELFTLYNAKGEPLCNRKLLKNIQLSTELNTNLSSFEEDPFLKARAMLDRDLNALSHQILNACSHEIAKFYEHYRKQAKTDLAESLSQALCALFLAGNPRHLVQNGKKKNTARYFTDFQLFLRASLKSKTYQKWLVYPPETSDSWYDTLMQLAHRLCFILFSRKTGIKQEAIGLIYRTTRRGGEKQNGVLQDFDGGTLWSHLLMDDEKLRAHLQKFPGGPLVKTLDLIRKDELPPFDPLLDGNLPVHLFDLKMGKKEVHVTRFPCPTTQSRLTQAEVLDEFRGYLRFLALHGQKQLIVQFQNPLSWKESARCCAIASLAKIPKFASHLFVLTLPKSSPFYYQTEKFALLHSVHEFKEAFRNVLTHPEENGFQFPPQWKKGIAVEFFDTAFPLIHAAFFQGQKELSRKEREDFIEIFYQFFIIKALDWVSPHYLSFMCKDGIDLSSAESACFYGMLGLIRGELKTKEEMDFLRYLFYFPALFMRERALDSERLHRALSMLECVAAADAKQVESMASKSFPFAV